MSESPRNISVQIVTAVAVLGLLFVRAPQTFTLPQFWAEDGTLFWHQQIKIGWHALFQPYAGYLHTAPRLIAALASFFPVSEAPTIYCYTAALLTAWTAAIIAGCFNGWIGLLYGVALLLPPQSGEVFGNITNIQWILAPALAVVLLADTTRWRSAFAALSAFTGPFSIFLLPVTAIQIVRTRSPIAFVVAIGGAVQLAALYFSTPPDAIPPGYVGAAHPIDVFSRIFETPAAAIAGIALIIVCLLVKPQRRGRLVWLYFGLVVTAATILKFRTNIEMLTHTGNGDRYFYIIGVMLLWSAISLLNGPWFAVVIAALFIVAYLNATAARFFKQPLPDMHWREHIERGDRTVNITPPGWFVYTK